MSLLTEAGLISDWLAHHARLRPTHTAVIDLATGRRFTYGEWFPRVARLAGALRERGVQPGDRVMVLARNSTDVYEVLFACWRIGAVFMPVNWRLAPSEIADILADATPALVVVDEEFVGLLPVEATNLTTTQSIDYTQPGIHLPHPDSGFCQLAIQDG